MSEMTKGQCLPGYYLIKYSVANSQGLSSAAYLTVIVEELMSIVLNYTFVPAVARSGDFDSVAAYAAQLMVANSSASSYLASLHLPYFGIDPTLLRGLTVNQTTVEPAYDLGNGTLVYPIEIQFTAVLVSVD